MYRKLTNSAEVEWLGLNIHEFHARDDETGDVQSFYTARERNDYIELYNEERTDDYE